MGDQQRVLGKILRSYDEDDTAAARHTTERDVCAKCGQVYPAYTYMFPCMLGCCRIGAKYQTFLGWTHICPNRDTISGFCISLPSDEHYKEAKRIFNTEPEAVCAKF